MRIRLLFALGCATVLLALGSRDVFSGDYLVEAWPAYFGLRADGLDAFMRLMPAYSGFVTLLGAPTALLGAGLDWTFRLNAIPGLLALAEPLKWVKPNESVDMLYIDGEPSDLQLTASVELEVTHTEPGVRGDTASGGGNKPATLETGATVNVPLFVNIGDKIKVDTRSGSYMSRA